MLIGEANETNSVEEKAEGKHENDQGRYCERN